MEVVTNGECVCRVHLSCRPRLMADSVAAPRASTRCVPQIGGQLHAWEPYRAHSRAGLPERASWDNDLNAPVSETLSGYLDGAVTLSKRYTLVGDTQVPFDVSHVWPAGVRPRGRLCPSSEDSGDGGAFIHAPVRSSSQDFPAGLFSHAVVSSPLPGHQHHWHQRCRLVWWQNVRDAQVQPRAHAIACKCG